MIEAYQNKMIMDSEANPPSHRGTGDRATLARRIRCTGYPTFQA